MECNKGLLCHYIDPYQTNSIINAMPYVFFRGSNLGWGLWTSLGRHRRFDQLPRGGPVDGHPWRYVGIIFLMHRTLMRISIDKSESNQYFLLELCWIRFFLFFIFVALKMERLLGHGSWQQASGMSGTTHYPDLVFTGWWLGQRIDRGWWNWLPQGYVTMWLVTRGY